MTFVDGLDDLVRGELQGISRPRLFYICPSKGLLGNVDLKGNLLLELDQAGLLPFQLRVGKLELSSRLLHLIAVVHRLDFRNYLTGFDLVVFLDKETNQPS